MLQKDHIERINNVIKHIQQNLNLQLTLPELASLANYSPFHFQRIFKSIVGETPKQYIRRVRLEHAAHHITLKPDVSMIEVAFEFGFSSLETFSVAFKNYYSISPNQFRKSDESQKLSIIQKKTNSALYLKVNPSMFLSTSVSINTVDNHGITITKLPGQKLIYIPTTLEKIEASDSSLIKVKQWAATRELVEKESNPFGLMLDFPLYTPVDKCQYYACIEVSQKTEVSGEINYMEIPSRIYATFLIKKGVSEMIRSIVAVVNHWLSENGYIINHVPMIQIPLDSTEKHLDYSSRIYLAILPK